MRKTTKIVFCVLFVVSFVASAMTPLVLKTNAAPASWGLVIDSRAMKGYPDLREYSWEKTPALSPNTQYDRIGLHRLVKLGTAPKGAVFIHEASLGSGDRVISNPPTDSWTKSENNSQAIYWANRGFEVYSMDSRPHFLPSNLTVAETSVLQYYGWDVWISDMKEAVDKIKEVSGFNKIFWVAHGAPSIFAVNYATVYGKQDLKGLIFLDADFSGRPVIAKRGNESNTYNLTKQIESMVASKSWIYANLTTSNARAKYASDNPGAPAQYPPGTPLTPTINPATNKSWTNITEYMVYNYYNLAQYGIGGISNLYGGYGNITVLLQYMSQSETLVSARYPLEIQAMIDWINCPYLTYDFDDHYDEIDVPVLAMASQKFSNKTGTFKFVNGLGTSDFTTKMLPNYGLYDMIIGTYSARDVSQPILDWMISHTTSGWTQTTDPRPLKAYPDLRETIWQKVAAMPPNGQYDKIGLHRLVKTGTTPKGVVFFVGCPMWGMGEQRISNPSTDNWTKTEAYSAPIYYANRGYDVYAIDFRPNFVPKTLNGSQVSAIAEEWGWDLWVSDTKEAAEKIKEVSGTQKFFITGECTGGFGALNYATKYWQEDIRGIILIDANFPGVPGYPIVGSYPQRVTNSFDMTHVIEEMIANATAAYDTYQPLRPVITYALQNPGAPAQYQGKPVSPAVNPATNKSWTNITEWFFNRVQNSFGSSTIPPGSISNLAGGYGNITQVEYCFTTGTFIPYRLIVEDIAMADWNNCPYLKYDYNDHYSEIGVPILAYAGPYTNQTGNLRFVDKTANADFTATYNPKYGHLDFFFGTDSTKDISQNVVNWMSNRYQTPAASTFSSVTIFAGQSWYFCVHSNGGVGPHKYQWYEGTTPIIGQTDMVLRATKPSAGTFTYFCKITDAEGTTVSSTPVTLTVR